MPRKRLDSFYKDQIISVAESHSLNDGYNRLYDVLMDELNEMHMKGLEIDFEHVIDRIEKKYLDLNRVFFEQVEKEKDVLLKIMWSIWAVTNRNVTANNTSRQSKKSKLSRYTYG